MMFDPPMSNKSFWSAAIVAAVLMGLLFFWIAHSERAVRIHNDQQWSAFAAHATTEDQRLLVQYMNPPPPTIHCGGGFALPFPKGG